MLKLHKQAAETVSALLRFALYLGGQIMPMESCYSMLHTDTSGLAELYSPDVAGTHSCYGLE